MRQRLLLVAGWIVAAVGAGVVASGAVAVAGGQVFDRPIRPLNAAEVAALPVDESLAALEPSVRLASGGSQASTGDATEGGRDTAGASGSERPARPGGVTAEAEIDLIRVPPTVTHVSGGSASVSSSGDEWQILWATPKPSYAVSFDFDLEQLVLIFTSEGHRSVIQIRRSPEGEIAVSTDEQEIR